MPAFARFSANHNFRPEQLNGYELGYRGLAGPIFYIAIASFYNHYGDLFSKDLLGAPFVETTPLHSPSVAGAVREWVGGNHDRKGR